MINLKTSLLTKSIVSLTGAVMITSLLNACSSYPASSEEDIARIKSSPQYRDGKFRNEKQFDQFSFAAAWRGLKEMVTNKHPQSVPGSPIPLQDLSASDFSTPNNTQALRFVRLGHSTILIELGGKYWLTDPVFSQRTSPVQWMGPKRFHPLPIAVEDLPPIEGVLISHNHYDHLDHASIVQLKDKAKHFFVPLGVGDALLDWGVAADKVHQLDWWQSFSIENSDNPDGKVELIATPTQHFSGRGVTDSDKTLWASWVLKSEQHRLYFSGDSGYFPGFKQIGERYGPFDYAFMECGAYSSQWPDVHMNPRESLQAFNDVRGRFMIPIHNGTFDLSTHAWYDPLDQISTLAAANNVEILTPQVGHIIEHNNQLNQPQQLEQLSAAGGGQNWWQQLKHIDQQRPEVIAFESKRQPQIAQSNIQADSQLEQRTDVQSEATLQLK